MAARDARSTAQPVQDPFHDFLGGTIGAFGAFGALLVAATPAQFQGKHVAHGAHGAREGASEHRCDAAESANDRKHDESFRIRTTIGPASPMCA
jgi:hypothetical protein